MITRNIRNGRGETFTMALRLRDSTGAVVDLTGHSVSLVVSHRGQTLATYAATIDGAGWINLRVTDEVTETWPTGNLRYLVIHLQPNGDERWLLGGLLEVKDGARL